MKSTFNRTGSRLLAGAATIALSTVALSTPAHAIVPNDNYTPDDIVDKDEDFSGVGMFFRNDGFLEPSLWIKYVDGAPINADLNLRYQTPNSIWIGTGISSAGNFHFEAGFNLGENVGLYNNVKIGYSYDYSFSSFGPSVGNTHELQVSYSFDR